MAYRDQAELLRAPADAVNYVARMAMTVRQMADRSHGEISYVSVAVRLEDIGLLESAADLLRPALDPKTHIGTGGRLSDEIRYSARDVAAMIEIALAVHAQHFAKGPV